MDSDAVLRTRARRRVSQDSQRLCRRAPSPLTPDDSPSAFARCFLGDDRLRHLRKGGRRHWCNEVESGSLALGSRHRRDGRSARSLVGHGQRTDPFRAVGCPLAPDRSYMCERAIHMSDSFQSARVARVTLAYRSHGETEQNGGKKRDSGRLPAPRGRHMDREHRDHECPDRRQTALVIAVLSIHVARDARSRRVMRLRASSVAPCLRVKAFLRVLRDLRGSFLFLLVQSQVSRCPKLPNLW
jgi:hypothetical protein